MKDTVIKTVSYQGIAGSYSHAACSYLAPHAQAQGFHTFEETVEAAENKTVDATVIPIENNIGGRVAEIHHILLETSLTITAEFFFPIKHCLLGERSAQISTLKNVYSHPQAIMQCKNFIQNKRLKPHFVHDTAYSAKFVSTLKNGENGAIASEHCAHTYNLKILAKNIANNNDNITRFILMEREQKKTDTIKCPITALIFQLRSVPAALYKALGGFATNNINMIKLESYVSAKNFAIVHFYAEIAADFQDEKNAHAMEELSYFAEWVKIIGIFEQHKNRLIM